LKLTKTKQTPGTLAKRKAPRLVPGPGGRGTNLMTGKPEGVVMLPLLNRLNYERLLILLAVSAGGGGSMRGVRLAAMPTAAVGRL
jgi:hypothetical protein